MQHIKGVEHDLVLGIATAAVLHGIEGWTAVLVEDHDFAVVPLLIAETIRPESSYV
jgi:hypothetical protein